MISTTVNSIAYSGNNSTTTPYALPFPFIDPDHITASVTDSGGTVTPLTPGTDFVASGVVDSHGRYNSGSVVTTAAVAVSSSISFKRVTPALQETDFRDGGRLSAESLELSLDRVVMVAQEAVRDATGGGETNVEASGTGLVAQTAAGIFAVRTISVEEDTGLAMTNGDGVAGNPTINLNNTLLEEVDTALSTDLVRLETSGGPVTIPIGDLIDSQYPIYRTVEIPTSQARVAGGSSGVTITDQNITFTYNSGGGVSVYFVVPEDYAGGVINFRFHAFLNSGTDGDQWVISLAARAYNQGSTSLGSEVSGSANFHTLTHNAADARTDALTIGSNLEAGKAYVLSIGRYGADALDDTTLVGYIKSIRFQYQANRDLAGW